jgi:putative endonuclease
MINPRQRFGKKSEALAVRHLKRNGYRILEQNYRNRLGEIDIIAQDRNTLVFVEVKAGRTNKFGNPKWAVTPKKQRKISMVALSYLKTLNKGNVKARFDVVSIQKGGETPQIEIVKNAFELAYE